MLANLGSHPIFSVPSGSASEEWELVDRPSDVTIGTKSSKLAVREKDIIVAVDSEVRMASLAHGIDESDEGSGSYRVRFTVITGS